LLQFNAGKGLFLRLNRGKMAFAAPQKSGFMRIFVKIGLFLYNIYAVIIFLALMFLIMPGVIFASFLGKMQGGNIIYALCRFWTDSGFFLWGIWHKNYFEQPHDKTKQYIFVSNHISFLDIPVIFKVIRGQRIRILGKYEMSKIPVFGFLYRNAVVMVNRSDAEHRRKSLGQLKSVIRNGVSVFICPEGTFNMTGKPLKEFYNGAFRLAIEMQTPIKPLLFLDTYDRMNYKTLLSLRPGKNRAVYLEEVPVEGLTINDVDMLKQKVYDMMEERLIHYKASWIKEV
jgi:1-acyl-sn-glycerol-3-phosphate acyltransferase